MAKNKKMVTLLIDEDQEIESVKLKPLAAELSESGDAFGTASAGVTVPTYRTSNIGGIPDQHTDVGIDH